MHTDSNWPAPVATILIPVHNHGELLYSSLASALRQTVPVEVFVIGDGATEETKSVVRAIAADDSRVRFFDHPKGQRHGEVYRHQALQQARGRIVCYLSDNALYLPHHVEHMLRLLEYADFAHAVAVRVQADQSVGTWTVDLAMDVHRNELLEGRNRIPLSAGAHTLASYRKLSEGWSPAPLGVPTDLFMWQKFIRSEAVTFRAGHRPSVLVFPDTTRQHMTLPERAAELRTWEKIPFDEIAERVSQQKLAEACQLDAGILSARLHGGELLRPDEFQVFLPRIGGYREQDSTRISLTFGSWQSIEVELEPCSPGVAIRIDPASQVCLIEFASLRLTTPDGVELWRLTTQTAGRLHVGGNAITVDRGGTVEILSDGDDPQVYLPVVPGKRIRLEASIRVDVTTAAIARAFARFLRAAA